MDVLNHSLDLTVIFDIFSKKKIIDWHKKFFVHEFCSKMAKNALVVIFAPKL